MTRLLTVVEVASHLNVSERFVRRHAIALGARKVGSLLRFRPASVDAWLDAQSLEARKGSEGR